MAGAKISTKKAETLVSISAAVKYSGEETGDVLLQVVFHAQIEAEKGGYTLDDVLKGVCEKMIYRHPHVFSTGVTAETPEEVLVNWEALKKKEKHLSSQTEAMRNVPDALPALLRAKKVQKKDRKSVV